MGLLIKRASNFINFRNFFLILILKHKYFELADSNLNTNNAKRAILSFYIYTFIHFLF